VVAGDIVAFAQGLKVRGYYTASSAAYITGMKPPFNAFMSGQSYEIAVAAAVAAGTLLATAAIAAGAMRPDDETPAPIAVRTTPGIGPIVHPAVELPERTYDGDDDDDGPEGRPDGDR
jgi:hypothetical protein